MEERMDQPISMYRAFVDNLNIPWRDFMLSGSRECLSARAGRPLELAPAPCELLFVASGHVRLYSGYPAGSRTLMLFMGPNCLINMEAFEDTPSLFSRVVVTRPAVLYRLGIGKSSREEIIRRFPALFVNAVQSLAAINLLFLYRAHALTFSTAQSRLCRLLLNLDGGSPSQPEVTQKDMGEMIGVHPETVSRLLASLRREGIIGKRKAGKIPLLDRPRLEARIREEDDIQPWRHSHVRDA